MSWATYKQLKLPGRLSLELEVVLVLCCVLYKDRACRTYSLLLSSCLPFPEVVWGSFKALGGSKDTGLVICAHCNCMAGLGKACCHISAVLFTLEINAKLKDSMSCTSLPCT